MEDDRLVGKLAVILHADIAGSTNLVRLDEHLAHARIQDSFQRFSLVIEKYQGRVRELRGDALLAEFSRASDAVCAALAFQEEHQHYLEVLTDSIKPVARIGIAMGEVVIANNTVTGAGVVLSQRIEQLTHPGSVCITAAIHEGLPDRFPFEQIDLGEQAVKGFDELIRVYEVRLDPEHSIPPPQQLASDDVTLVSKGTAFAAVLGFLVVAMVLWIYGRGMIDDTASIERMAYPLPDKPSIAVLPLNNLSGDESQDYFADGMTEDLITDLSKNPELFVISRNSTFTYKGRAVKIREVAEDLGVRYVLEGSVRRDGDRVRINAQLIDALSGGHLWAERYDGSMSDVFTLQDQVVSKIASALTINLISPAMAESGTETDVPQAYDAFLRGWGHLVAHSKEDIPHAVSFFEQATRLDPDYGRAHAGLAKVYWDISNLGWENLLDITWGEAAENAEKALALALIHPTAEAHAVNAEMLANWGRQEEALVEIDRALKLAPGSANYLSKAKILNSIGRAEEAEEVIRLALRQDPNVVPDTLRTLGHSLFHQKRYHDAATTLERVVDIQPEHHYTYASLAATYGYLERYRDAKKAIDRYNELVGILEYTPITVQEIGWWWDGDMYDYDRGYIDQLREGLRKAGVPEGAAPQSESFDFESLVSKRSRLYEVDGATRIDAVNAKKLYDQGAVFIDVRDAGSFARQHIPGAHNLDLNLDFELENLSQLISKEKPVVIQCWMEICSWAAYACAKAVLWDYRQVYYFAGGIHSWAAAGYPVEGRDLKSNEDNADT